MGYTCSFICKEGYRVSVNKGCSVTVNKGFRVTVIHMNEMNVFDQ